MRLPLCFETSLSRTEFLRLLPAAVGGAAYVNDGSVFRCQQLARAWQITLEPLPEMKLGLVRLDRQRLSFLFENYTDPEIAEFMRRFEMYFRRGGG